MAQADAVRTIWISDLHLGSAARRIDLLIDFLKSMHCEKLYLVGDIIHMESLRRSFYWPESHTKALRLVLQMSQRGTRVIYIPGNHDDDFRVFCGSNIGPIEVKAQDSHTTFDGRRLLVLHGDEFDSITGSKTLTAFAGSFAYRSLLNLNRLVHGCHRLVGRPYWSLAQHVKSRLSKAARYVENFRRVCVKAAGERRFDGVVCGHIHKAELVTWNGRIYCNDGDWVESCTAVLEYASSELAVVDWCGAKAVPSESAMPIRDAA